MAQDIRTFVSRGAVADPGHLIVKQPHEERRLRDMMRGSGYVPVLDITPLVTTEYLPDKGTFKYEITVYGTRAKQPHAWEGWLGGRLIPKAPSPTRDFEEVVAQLV